MCGRLILTSPVAVLAQLFDLLETPESLPPRYNLAPTQLVPVVRASSPRTLELLRWGLDLHDPRYAGINARVESRARPIYRDKLRDKRCLVVADGFFEWRVVAGAGKKKQPYRIARRDGAPLVMAGIYDASDGFAILTAPARGVIAALHDRMPVMLDGDARAAWLDASRTDVGELLDAEATIDLVVHPVSTKVNQVRNDDATLTEPVAEPEEEVATVEPKKGVTLSLF